MPIPVLPHDVISIMSSRMMRVHHYLWHTTRNMWLRYDEPTKNELSSLGWEPPRPSQDKNGNWIPDNNSGEDFFFMHREMIKTANDILKKVGQTDYLEVTGWETLPTPNDPDYPVPPAWITNNKGLDKYLAEVKGIEYFQKIQQWEKKFRDPIILKENTLGWLGTNVESTIHNIMHMRWCAEITQLRPDNEEKPYPDIIDRKWDVINYNWLGDVYSSHVNPIFWKIHGWVDNCVNIWAQSNNISQDSIPWKGKWSGPMQMATHHNMTQHDFLMMPTLKHEIHMSRHEYLNDLEKALAIVQKSGKFCHFYDR